MEKKIKLIVVLVCILGLGSLGAAFTFFRQKSMAHERYLEAEKRYASVQDKLTASEMEKAKIRKEMATIEAELDKLTKQQAELKQKYDSALAKRDSLSTQLQSLTEEKATLEARVKRSVEELSAANEELQAMKEERESFQAQISQLKAELQDKIKEIAQARQLLDELEAKKKTAEEELRTVAPPLKTAETLEARILSVNEENNFVVINKGKDDGLKVGMNLGVFRNEKRIGEVQVIEMRKKVAACDIKEIEEWREIKVNDLVR